MKSKNMHYFKYLLIFTFILNVNGAIIKTSGCYHNGTIYGDGSLVPTTEPCLSCKCNARMLICSLKICPEMPVPPPRGCVLVQKKNSCCPYLSCLKIHDDATTYYYNIPNRRIVSYLDHFERESIDRAVNENFLHRRSDDLADDIDNSGEICVKNGTVYKSGSAMSSSSLCSYCYCIGGQQKCVKPKCMLPLDGCKAIFVDSTCCPVRYDCTIKTFGKSSHRSHARKTGNKHYQRMSQGFQRTNYDCKIGNSFYPEGQKMPNDLESPCDICFCIRGVRKCTPKKCSPSLRNCIPVIPKGQCCPSSYECSTMTTNSNTKDLLTTRSYQARQIGLFSFIFGSDTDDSSSTTTSNNNTNNNSLNNQKDPITKVLPAATGTATVPASSTLKPIQIEKTIFDVIRAGLEYIDNNTNNLTTTSTTIVNNNNSEISTTTLLPTPQNIVTNLSTTSVTNIPIDSDDDDFSFFDILMGNNNPKHNQSMNLMKNHTKSLNSSHQNGDDDEIYKDYDDDDENMSFLDILLGPSDHKKNKMKNSTLITTTITPNPNKSIVMAANDSMMTTDMNNDFDYFGSIENDTTFMDYYLLNAPPQLPETTTIVTVPKIVSTTTTPIGKDSSVIQTTNSGNDETTTNIPPIITTITDNPEVNDYFDTTTTSSSSIVTTTIDNNYSTSTEENTGTSTTLATDYDDDDVDDNQSTTTTDNYNNIEARTTEFDNDYSTTTNTSPLDEILSTTTTDNNQITITMTTLLSNNDQNTEATTNQENPLTTTTQNSNHNNLKESIENTKQEISNTLTNITASNSTNTNMIFEDDTMISDDIFTSLLNGLSNLLGENENVIESSTLTPAPIPTKNENITKLNNNTEHSLLTPLNNDETLIEKLNIKPLSSLTTENPTETVIIKTNPSILDLSYDYGHHTLPPSLPNLKIIPFLPVDALPTEKRPTRPSVPAAIAAVPVVPSSSTSYIAERHAGLTWGDSNSGGISSTNGGSFESDIKSVQPYEQTNHHHHLHQHQHHYPSLTYTQNTDLNNNINNNNENPNILDGNLLTYSNNHRRHGFSPPTKTEGGFLPKDPNLISNLYYDTKLLIELTTTSSPISLPSSVSPAEVAPVLPAQPATIQIAESMKKKTLTTENPIIIDITSIDPFKNVIKTEPSPDLASLYEDKENQIPKEHLLTDNIHITTDSNYNYTPPEFNEYNHQNHPNNLNISNISFTENSDEISYENYNQTTEQYQNEINSHHQNTVNISKNINEINNSNENDKHNGIGQFFQYFLQGPSTKKMITTTIPPFRTVPPHDDLKIHEFMQTLTTIKTPEQIQLLTPQNTNNHSQSIISTSTKPNSFTINNKNQNNNDNLNFIEKLLIKTEFTIPDSELYKPIPQRQMTTVQEYENHKKFTTQLTTTNDPFKGLPLTQSYPVKPKVHSENEYSTFNKPHLSTSTEEIDMILSHINKKSYIKGATYTVGAYKLLPNDLITTNSGNSNSVSNINNDPIYSTTHDQQSITTTKSSPVAAAAVEVAAGTTTSTGSTTTEIFTKSNNQKQQHFYNDPAGILLAGCNIYGRMYRVGRIISELSDACLECKCTEIGVSCMSLECVRSS